MTELRAVYTAPTGVITQEVLSQLIQEMFRSGKPLPGFDELKFMPELIGQIGKAIATDHGLDIGSLELEGEAMGTITHHCADLGDGEPGTAVLHFLATDSYLDPSIWGELVHCAAEHATTDLLSSFQATYEGNFNVWLVDQNGFMPNIDDWLLRFDGDRIEIESGEALSLAFDFRWRDNDITTRIALPDGAWFFFTYTIGTLDFYIQDTLGTIECVVETLSCTSDDHPIGSISL